jgi:quinol monooxygenase YgiN
MIVVAGRAVVRAECVEEAKAAAVAVTGPSLGDAGCITYRFFSSVENPAEFLVFEEWESAEALDSHLRQEHVKQFFATITPLLEAAPVITRYEVTDALPL